ncbi:MAG: hypothetical protein AAF420_05190, partial [Pseudomonadota bacterium]
VARPHDGLRTLRLLLLSIPTGALTGNRPSRFTQPLRLLHTRVHREGSDKNNCTHEIASDALQPGQSLYLWMNFMVPRNQQGKVLVQLNHDGVTRDTRVMQIAGSMRSRTWRKIRLLRPG